MSYSDVSQGSQAEQDVLQSLRSIFIDYFGSGKRLQPEQQWTAFEAVIHSFENNRKDILSDRYFFDECFPCFLRYVIVHLSNPVFLDERSVKETDQAVNIIASFVTLCRPSQRIRLIEALLDSITILATENVVVIPTGRRRAEEEHLECPTRETMIIFLRILSSYMSTMLVHTVHVLFTLDPIMKICDEELRYWVIKCLSLFHPQTISSARTCIMILLRFATTCYSEITERRAEIDDLMTTILLNSMPAIPEAIMRLVIQELLNMMDTMTHLVDTKLLDTILDMIDNFSAFDATAETQVACIFVKVFEQYCTNIKFILLCARICHNNKQMKETIKARYMHVDTTFLARLTISDDLVNELPPTLNYMLLYELACKVEVQSPMMCSLLTESLKVNAPALHQIAKLVNFIPCYVVMGFAPDVRVEYFQHRPDELDKYKEDLVKFALRKQGTDLRLASLLVARYPEYASNFVDMFIEHISNPAIWQIPHFPKAYCNCMKLDPEHLKFPSDLFQVLLRHNRAPDFLVIETEPELWPYYLGQLWNSMSTGSVYEADAAYSVFVRTQNFSEMFALYAYDFASFMFAAYERGHIIFKLIGENLLEHHLTYNIDDSEHFREILLERLTGWIIPQLVMPKDGGDVNLRGLEYLVENIYSSKDDKRSLDERITEKLKEHVDDILVYTFMFSTKRKPESFKRVLAFLGDKLHKRPTPLMQDVSGSYMSKVSVFLAHHDPAMKAKAKRVMGLLDNSMKDLEEKLQEIWSGNFFTVFIDYTRHLSVKKSPYKKAVITALTESAGNIAFLVDKYSPKILSLMELAMQNTDLRRLCITFWDVFTRKIHDKKQLEFITGPIVAMLIPYFDEYPAEITTILSFLIIENKEWTKPCFSRIASVPLFSQYKDSWLSEISKTLVEHTEAEDMDWRSRLAKLGEELENGNLPYRRLILQQILAVLKEKAAEEGDKIDEETSMKLLWQLWESLSHETTEENLPIYGRCLAFLPFVHIKVDTPDRKAIDPSRHAKIMRTLISEFLVRVLDDSTSYLHYDHAACAIQFLLQKLGCSRSHDLPIDNKNWNKLSQSVQNTVEPYLRTRYKPGGIPPNIPLQSVAASSKTFKDWVTNFTYVLLKETMENKEAPDFMSCCVHAIPDSISLCKFMIPYLCQYNIASSRFQTFLRREWRDLLEKNSEYFAKLALQVLLSLFDTLNQWGISAGSKERQKDWILLKIADEEGLYRASMECGMYFRALMHLEFDIRDNGGDWSSRSEELRVLYEHLGDPDALEAVTTNTDPEIDILSAEAHSLSSGSSEDMIGLLHTMFHEGRYERAYADAINLNMDLVKSNPSIQAVIANASVRLLRWDDLHKMKFNDQYASPQTQFDISLAKVMCYHHYDQKDLFREEVERARKLLIPPFRAASMTSYSCMMPIIARYGVIEEISDCYGVKDQITFSNWERDLLLRPADIEKIVAVRCALIDTCFTDAAAKASALTNQWLHLAQIYRKSGNLVQSRVFSGRAKQYAVADDDICRCILETAKTNWDGGMTVTAMALLNTARPTNDTLRGKVMLMKARWSESMQNEDADTIMKSYTEAATLLGKSGKVFFAMANLADKRIAHMIEANEHISQDKQSSSITKRGSSKFWGPPSATKMANFLTELAPIFIENYLKSLQLSPQYAHEIVCRVLYLMFDIGKYLVPLPKTQPQQPEDTSNPFRTLSPNQKTTILQAMIKAFEDNIGQVKAAVWLNNVTQLISRVEQPAPLEKHLFTLIKYSLLNYPDATCWHLMSIKQSSYENRPEKFEELWRFCERDMISTEQPKFEELKYKFLHVTNDLIQLTSMPNEKRAENEISVNEMFPSLAEQLNDSHLVMPLLSTLNIRVSDSSEVTSFPRILRIHDTIKVLNSQQRPMKIRLDSTTGGYCNYLVKKDDDLRKDMRMMEFASFMNKLLSHDRECRQRKLSMRTFAVVCLNERCGIIEWVDKTVNFRAIVQGLINELGKGIRSSVLKDLMFEGSRIDSTIREKKYHNFVEKILPAYPPVMHLWQVSKFNVLSQWFQARLNYTRSAAVWSMVGYILGLGDRHAENILISEEDGSCLHVDFCCLFDRSKSLPIPEIVPFRLTQNIVDGMGILKTDGTFFTSAKLVMETMRTKKQKVISVWNAFESDPLLEWKKGGRAGMEMQAKRTLEGINNRLSGVSEDLSTIYSPECIVKELIAQATDNTLLAQMYIGWQAYL